MTRRFLLRLSAALCALLAAAVPAAAESAVPHRNDRVYRIDFSDTERFTREWQFNGALPMVPHTDFYLATVSSAEDGRVLVIESDRASVHIFPPDTLIKLRFIIKVKKLTRASRHICRICIKRISYIFKQLSSSFCFGRTSFCFFFFFCYSLTLKLFLHAGFFLRNSGSFFSGNPFFFFNSSLFPS